MYIVINTSCTICHLFVSTGSLSVETLAYCEAVLIREPWVEVVTSTRPGDTICVRSSYGSYVTLVCIHMGGDCRHVASSCVLCVWNLRQNTTASSDLGEPTPDSCT